MPKSMKNVLLLGKIETVYGTDPIPTAGANAILCKAVSPTPLVPEMVDRELVRPFYGNSGKLTAAVHSEFEVEVEIAGAGTAGTVPKYGFLLRACGLSETVTASTDVKYAPVTTAQESATFYYYLDGVLHKMTGCRGSLSYALNAKQIPVMRFKFIGLYTTPVDGGMPALNTVDYSGFKDPVVVNSANSATWNLHGVTGKLEALALDLANEVGYRAIVNSESVLITDRKPSGSATIEMEAMSVKDWYSAVRSNATGTLSFQHGATAGNIVILSGAKAQLSNISAPANSNNIATTTLSFEFLPTVGNDEFLMTVK